MERKNKKELLVIIDEQNKNLFKYKSRLHDIVEAYKRLVKEKETLEDSVKALTQVDIPVSDSEEVDQSDGNKTPSTDSQSECFKKLKSNLGALTAEKVRVENELKADRKKLLTQKEELEKNFIKHETIWFDEKEKYENLITELKQRISAQQREREKEQQDHVLMLKELQAVLTNERLLKEKLEEQVSELQQKSNAKISERKIVEYEKIIEDLKNQLVISQNQLKSTKNEVRKLSVVLEKLEEEMDDVKSQYMMKLEEEKERADKSEEKLKLLTAVKEKRITSLESRISELSELAGDHDKQHQQNVTLIQKLKTRISQMQLECSTSHNAPDDYKYLEKSEGSSNNHKQLRSKSDSVYPGSMFEKDDNQSVHAYCHDEISRLKEELEQWKAKADCALHEKLSKPSNLISDARAAKEIKELRSRLTQLQDQLQSCKSQLKLSEEYHNKITANLEKSIEDLRTQHKQGLSQIEAAHRGQLLELEHQIQKQRERTLSLLEEKDKEIVSLKSSFIVPYVQHRDEPATLEDAPDIPPQDHNASTPFLPSSLISTSKSDHHILHYLQELSRKDVEISTLRKSNLQSSSSLRKLQQISAVSEEASNQELEALRSKVRRLESGQDEEGTNIEYLKNVVLNFLKCRDTRSKRHMVNAIATVLHFTKGEVQEVRDAIC